LQAFCSQTVAEQRLRGFLTQLFEHRAPALEAPQA
jgi:hypothetical protein